VPTQEAALLEFVGMVRGSVHVALEEGTQAQWLHDLLRGSLRSVYYGSSHRAALKELARTYENAVEDTMRTMLR